MRALSRINRAGSRGGLARGGENPQSQLFEVLDAIGFRVGLPDDPVAPETVRQRQILGEEAQLLAWLERKAQRLLERYARKYAPGAGQ